MTSQDESGKSPQDNHDPLEETQQLQDTSFRSRHKSGRLWIGLSVVVLAGVAAAALYIVTGGTQQTGTGQATTGQVAAGQAAVNGSATQGASPGTAKPSGSATTPKGTSTTKGKVISAAKLAEQGGALSLPANMQGSVASWQSGPGGRDLTAVSSRLGQALQASGIRQYSSMKDTCTQLASSVSTAKAGPPIPQAAMQNLYTQALTELAKGAADCQQAISIAPTGDETIQAHVDTATLRKATSEISAGATDVFRSTAEIQIASRQQH
jgi:4-amino-4-deoxy-L-arabinose transferase-like glycosyltransferase